MKAYVRRALVGVAAALAVALLALAARMDRAWLEIHMMRLRCAVEPSDLHLMTAWRVGLAAAGVALLLLLRPTARWLARDGAGGALLRAGFAAVLAIGVSDLLMRFWSRAGRAPTVLIALPPIHEDPRLGWVYDGPRTSVLVADDRSVMYAFDAAGNRVHAQTDTIDPEKPTILFVGESVVMGLGVHWEEAFPTLVGQRLGVQVVNAGVHGYGDDQIYVRLLEELEKLRRPLAVVDIAIADLLERDVATWRSHLDPGEDGSFRPISIQPELWRKSPVAALVERLGPWQSGGSVRIARAAFLEMARVAHARGAYPLFLLTNYQRPCLPDASGRPSIEATLFDDLPVNHVRVDLDPTWIVRSNGHPDARGQARLANGVAEALRAAGVAPQ